MELHVIGLLSILFLFALVAVGVPIAFSMLLVGFLGYTMIGGIHSAVAQLTLVAWHESAENFVMVCVPLYIFMGYLVANTGLARNLYSTAYKWMGHFRGGLAMATVIACGGFGAITGSSSATASTIGSMAKPQMDHYGYDNRLSTGCLAASGTLGVLIPPSLIFVFYGAMTEESIGQLFLAGVLPGILTIVVYIAAIYIWCRVNKNLAPAGPKFTWRERFSSMISVWPILVIFMLVIGGIYGGVFTPTEAAGVGSSLTLLVTMITKRMTWKAFIQSIEQTAKLTAMIIVIVFGGILYARFLALTGVTESLVHSILSVEMNRYVMIFAIILLYLGLGMVLDVYGMLVLTLPVIYPVILGLGFSGIWFGVVCVLMAESALITPPVGVNVFIISGVAPDVPIDRIFKGIGRFFIANVVVIFLCIVFPWISTWLPSRMMAR